MLSTNPGSVFRVSAGSVLRGPFVVPKIKLRLVTCKDLTPLWYLCSTVLVGADVGSVMGISHMPNHGAVSLTLVTFQSAVLEHAAMVLPEVCISGVVVFTHLFASICPH